LDGDITASNFVKARDDKNYNTNDIAAALTNMTGEIIGTVAYLNALLVGVNKVYFVGRIPLLKSLRDAIDQRLELAGVSSEYNPNMEYANAIGALAYLQGKI
jgi:pantothenate kinase